MKETRCYTVYSNNFGYIYNIFLVDYFVQDFSHFLLDTVSVGTVRLPKL